MRRDRERILDIMLDIREALDSLARSLVDCKEADFLSNDLLCDASAHKLTIVGEAAARMSDEIKDRHPQIEWRKAIALRNVLVHEYFGVDRPMVWEVAIVDAPLLRDRIAAILLAEFPE
jgi:uncharacterized protein with HEPN domain